MAQSQESEMVQQLAQAKAALKDGSVVSIAVNGVGAYTVGMDALGLPDLVVIDNVEDDSDERALFLSSVVVNFYHHVSMMHESKQSKVVIEHIDYYVSEEESARFLLRKVKMDKPWEHLAVQRDLMPNDSLVQIHLPDGKNRVLGDDGFTPNATFGERLFESTPDVFY